MVTKQCAQLWNHFHPPNDITFFNSSSKPEHRRLHRQHTPIQTRTPLGQEREIKPTSTMGALEKRLLFFFRRRKPHKVISNTKSASEILIEGQAPKLAFPSLHITINTLWHCIITSTCVLCIHYESTDNSFTFSFHTV